MPTTYTYPGVYVEEIPSGVRTITGVSTSDTAFIDFFPRGPMNEARRVTGMEDYRRRFGGLHRDSEASYAIRQYFLNGGQIAWVVRVAGGTPIAAESELPDGTSPGTAPFVVQAASEGTWGTKLEIGIDHMVDEAGLFNLVVREIDVVGGRKQVATSEVHRNVTLDKTSPRYVKDVLEDESELIRVKSAGTGGRPPATVENPASDTVTSPNVLGKVDYKSGEFVPFKRLGEEQDPPASDGSLPSADDLIEGLEALEKIAPSIFNLLCLPCASKLSETGMKKVIQEAAKFCEDRRAFLIVDPHEGTDTLDEVTAWLTQLDEIRHRNTAFYFPRVLVPDPLNEERPREVGASGTMAGVYARTDATRGVWKAPAGTDARLVGVSLTNNGMLTDVQNGGLNPVAVNVLRIFPVFGLVAWGARTLDGADQKASEWKYVSVRRTALYIEESLYQNLKWVVFEPNDEPLWSQIRLNVGAFMNDLFRQGAFQGTTPRDAYFVKCDAETTTQTDIDKGVVNILVGFAPLKPAEFVVIRIQQIAGQIPT